MELPVLQKTYDTLKWLIPKLEKMPRTQKYVLGDRLERAFFDLMGTLAQAALTRHKVNTLQKADAKLLEIRNLVRLLVDLKYMTIRQYEFITADIAEIGSMIGGWLKSRKPVPNNDGEAGK